MKTSYVLFTLLLMVLFIVSGCATTPTSVETVADSMDAQAQVAYDSEDWPQTERLYAMLVEQNPANGRYWYRLSVAQRYVGKLDKALESLDSGVLNGLPPSYADYERAKVAATRGNSEKAIALLTNAASAGLSGKDRILENDQLAALKGVAGFDEVLDQFDANAFPCREAVFHEFDFWIGTWEVKSANGTVAGHNTISAKESGCMLLEEWSSAGGGSGTSMNYYDVIEGHWTQVWISPGLQLRISGGMDNGSMVLTGKAHYIQQGNTAPFRGTWTPLEDGRVRQYFEQQGTDGSWAAWFEGFYTKIPVAVEQAK